jgi:hypothetical protein
MDIDARRKRHKINKENARNKAREFIAAYFATHPCVDCGESDRIVLTFDHVRGEKSNDIANMVRGGASLETIRIEIEKCEVRCFNCHAVKTHERLKSNRWKRLNGNGG